MGLEDKFGYSPIFGGFANLVQRKHRTQKCRKYVPHQIYGATGGLANALCLPLDASLGLDVLEDGVEI